MRPKVGRFVKVAALAQPRTGQLMDGRWSQELLPWLFGLLYALAMQLTDAERRTHSHGLVPHPPTVSFVRVPSPISLNLFFSISFPATALLFYP
jgi:hypothetical protein